MATSTGRTGPVPPKAMGAGKTALPSADTALPSGSTTLEGGSDGALNPPPKPPPNDAVVLAVPLPSISDTWQCTIGPDAPYAPGFLVVISCVASSWCTTRMLPDGAGTARQATCGTVAGLG